MPKKAGDFQERRNFRNFGKCCATLLPSCTAMTWVPTIGRRTPRTGQRSITQQARSLPSDVLAAGQTPMPLPVFVARYATPGFHVQNGADAQTCAAQPRPPPHRLTRSQKTGNSAEIRVLCSAALPSAAVSRALARNTPSC